jgi:hypothetical protein
LEEAEYLASLTPVRLGENDPFNLSFKNKTFLKLKFKYTKPLITFVILCNNVFSSDLLLSLAPNNAELKDQAAQQALEEAKAAGVVSHLSLF